MCIWTHLFLVFFVKIWMVATEMEVQIEYCVGLRDRHTEPSVTTLWIFLNIWIILIMENQHNQLNLSVL